MPRFTRREQREAPEAAQEGRGQGVPYAAPGAEPEDTVNPELAAANEVARVLLFPATSKVETFMKGRVELVEFKLKDDSRIIGMSLAELYRRYQIKILVCAVKRGEEVYIPDGDFVLEAGDKMHIAAGHQDLESFFIFFEIKKGNVRKVLICGGAHRC